MLEEEIYYSSQIPEFDKEHFEKVCSLSKMFYVTDLDNPDIKTPLALTFTQKLIWYSIMTRGSFLPKGRKMFVTITPSQYGKSLVVSTALLLRILSNPNEKWLLIAPTEPKAQIIMRELQSHLADNPEFEKRLKKTTKNIADKLNQEKSRKRLTLTNGSSIEILSADADSKSDAGIKLMGKGGANICVDESCEMTDTIESKIFRMLSASKDPFYFQLGNPWTRNHFYRDFTSVNFFKIWADFNIALEEGRFTEHQVDMARSKSNFDVLFGARFPDADALDNQGYAPLFTDIMIKIATRKEKDVPYWSGTRILGVDVSYKGKDSNVWVLRTDNAMRVVHKNHDPNPLNVVSTTMELARELGVEDRNIYIDSTAGGNVIFQRFLELGHMINGISFATKPVDTDHYRDIKAEGYQLLSNWISSGGLLIEDEGWEQLLNIKYKNVGGKMQIISKDELRSMGIQSPDIADAAMLTCVNGINTNLQVSKSEVLLKRKMQPKYR